jgi:tetratricopeptide (TPR) repeat protein
MPRSLNIPQRKLPMPAKSAPHQKHLELLISQGLATHQQGKLSEAKVIYEKVLAIQPNHFDTLQLLATLFGQTKEFTKALDLLTKALQINPSHAPCYSNLGIILQEFNRLDEALASYDKAIAIKPDYAEAHHNRGNALKDLNRLDEALPSFDKSITLKPSYAEAHSNRGTTLQELKRLEEALVSYDKAIAINPDYAEAHSNRGTALQELKRLDEALASYDKAISIKSDYASAHWNLSLCHLLRGNFKNGWEGYEWRWKAEDISNTAGVRNFSQPLWLGVESLKDKTILIYAEQGLGDTIQFFRYAQLVVELGAKVILEVQQPLVNLLQNLKSPIQIIAKGDTPTNFDYQCPLLSLPLAFKTELHTIPSLQSIWTHEEKIAKWQAQLGKKSKLRIGIVWSGSTEHKNDHNRSLTLSKLLPHLSPNVEYICLQKELRNIDKELLAEQHQIKYFGDALEDFTDTSALCELMDIVISVDTSVVHLAGTLRKPTWVLLPHSPDWRWLLDRNDSPWYPSVKLYRQEKIYDWDGVLEKVRSDLEKLVT